MVSHGYDQPVVSLGEAALENVPAFVYLGSTISGNTIAASDDVDSRIGKAAGTFARLKESMWKRRNISIDTKMKVFNASHPDPALHL